MTKHNTHSQETLVQMDFKIFGNRAKYARTFLNGYSLSDVERGTGINRSTIGVWEKRSEHVAKVDAENLLRAAEFYGVELLWLLNNTGPIKKERDLGNPNTPHLLPLIRWEDLIHHRSGTDVEALQQLETPGFINNSPRTVATTVPESMLVEFNAGDTLIVDPDMAPTNGQYLIYQLDPNTLTIVTYIELSGNRKHISALTDKAEMRNYDAQKCIAVIVGKYYN